MRRSSNVTTLQKSSTDDPVFVASRTASRGTTPWAAPIRAIRRAVHACNDEVEGKVNCFEIISPMRPHRHVIRPAFRYGEPISIDDALFSYEIASEFFARTKRIGVPVENRIGFAKALTKFFNFLNIFMDSGEVCQYLITSEVPS